MTLLKKIKQSNHAMLIHFNERYQSKYTQGGIKTV